MFKVLTPLLRNQFGSITRTMSSNAADLPKYTTLNLSVPKPFVYHVELNRPKQVNAINFAMWDEIKKCFDELSDNADCRAIVLSGSGKLFCGGIDLKDFQSLGPDLAEHEDVARKAKVLYKKIKTFQASLSSLEECNKPVITAIHNACIGAGVDLITASDIRQCTKDSYFQIKEILLGMAADVGTLQRLPKIIGNQGLIKELAYTGRILKADEALSCGLVSKVYPDTESLICGSIDLAEEIAKKSPVAIQCTKKTLNYARDHSVADSLEEIALRNQYLLQSEDFFSTVLHMVTKQEGDVKYSKL